MRAAEQIILFHGTAASASAAATLLAYDRGFAIDFTDQAFLRSTGYYGSAIVNDKSLAEAMLQGDAGLALDFTDTAFVGSTGYYGSAVVGQ